MNKIRPSGHFDKKRLEKVQNNQNWVFQIISNHFRGKSVEWPKLGVLNHFGPLWWEKMGESVKQSKWGIPNHFRPLHVEKIGKSVEPPKLGILNHFGLKLANANRFIPEHAQ